MLRSLVRFTLMAVSSVSMTLGLVAAELVDLLEDSES